MYDGTLFEHLAPRHTSAVQVTPVSIDAWTLAFNAEVPSLHAGIPPARVSVTRPADPAIVLACWEGMLRPQLQRMLGAVLDVRGASGELVYDPQPAHVTWATLSSGMARLSFQAVLPGRGADPLEVTVQDVLLDAVTTADLVTAAFVACADAVRTETGLR